MRVSGLLITHQLSEEAAGWFSDLRQVVDELVVFVDEDRADPAVRERLEKLDARIFKTRGPVFYNFDFAEIIGACQGDWVLKVDYDEELSREWHDPRWRQILEIDEFSHYWSPRRWFTTSDNYIALEPWWPDWQLRLFRNRPSEITFPTQLHETMRISGAGGFLRTLAIHHHDLRLASRAMREQKAEAYDRHHPGYGLGFFYLYEDFAVPELPAPEGVLLPDSEILRMAPLHADEMARIRVQSEPPPDELTPGELIWLNARLANGTDRPLVSGSPFPVNLAYHWLDHASRVPVVFDGQRTAVLPELPPHHVANIRMFVVAPLQAGEYILRITVVQEHVNWMDADGSDAVQDFRVRVRSTSDR